MPGPLLDASWLSHYAFAHRGLHEQQLGIPENSLAAFRQAVRAGYAIELDVQLLADGAIVVFHDATLGRMCGQDISLAELDTQTLRQYRLSGSAAGIPLLSEVLAEVAGRVPLLIELKGQGKPAPLARAVVAVLAGYLGQVAVQSFNPLSVWWLAHHAPTVLRGQLAGSHRTLGVGRLMSWLLRIGIGRPHFLAFEGAALPNPRVARQRAAGRPVLAWTVRSAAEAKRLQPAHCDGIIFEHFHPASR